jgi:hypothetical protein
MVDKPSWMQRAKNLFGSSDDKEEKEIEKSLHKLGIDILKDQKLEHRIKLLMQFHDLITSEIKAGSLVEYVADLKDRQDLVNEAIYEISAPYARSIDFPRLGQAIHGWGRWNASAKSWILRTDDIVRKAEEQKEKNKEKPKDQDKKDKEKSKDKEKIELEALNEPKDLESLKRFLDVMETETETIDVKMLVHFLHDVLQKHVWKDGFLILGKCFMDRDISPRSATVIQNVNAMREREDMTKNPDF